MPRSFFESVDLANKFVEEYFEHLQEKAEDEQRLEFFMPSQDELLVSMAHLIHKNYVTQRSINSILRGSHNRTVAEEFDRATKKFQEDTPHLKVDEFPGMRTRSTLADFKRCHERIVPESLDDSRSAQTGNLKYRFYFKPSMSLLFDGETLDNVKDLFQEAYSRWNESRDDICFNPDIVSSESRANVIVKATNFPDPSTLGDAHVGHPSRLSLDKSEIRFAIGQNWSDNGGASGTVDFVAVATHEIGHALGLSHNNDRDSIMFKSYNKDNLFPTTSDLNLAEDIWQGNCD